MLNKGEERARLDSRVRSAIAQSFAEGKLCCARDTRGAKLAVRAATRGVNSEEDSALYSLEMCTFSVYASSCVKQTISRNFCPGDVLNVIMLLNVTKDRRSITTWYIERTTPNACTNSTDAKSGS